MITPRKGTESGHHMKIVRVSTTPAKTSRVETTIYKRCQTCYKRKKIFKHLIGLKVCLDCRQAINKMFLTHNITQKDIQKWNTETKQQWIIKIDQMGLYNGKIQKIDSKQ